MLGPAIEDTAPVRDVLGAEGPLRALALPLEQAVELIVGTALKRHQQLHEMHPEFFRDHSVRYTLSTFNPNGADRSTEWVAMILACHKGRLATPSPERAAFLLTRALGAMLVTTVRERPRYLADAGFRDDLVRMVMGLIARPGPSAGAAESERAAAEAESPGSPDRKPAR